MEELIIKFENNNIEEKEGKYIIEDLIDDFKNVCKISTKYILCEEEFYDYEIIDLNDEELTTIFNELEQLYNCSIDYVDNKGLYFYSKIIEINNNEDLYYEIVEQHNNCEPFIIENEDTLLLKYNIYICFKCKWCDCIIGDRQSQMYLLEKYQLKGYLDKGDNLCEHC